jgi:hypothetical protein
MNADRFLMLTFGTVSQCLFFTLFSTYFYSIKYSVVKKAAWRPPDTDCSENLQEEDRERKGEREVSV